jgi:hypothetical protein
LGLPSALLTPKKLSSRPKRRDLIIHPSGGNPIFIKHPVNPVNPVKKTKYPTLASFASIAPLALNLLTKSPTAEGAFGDFIYVPKGTAISPFRTNNAGGYWEKSKKIKFFIVRLYKHLPFYTPLAISPYRTENAGSPQYTEGPVTPASCRQLEN